MASKQRFNLLALAVLLVATAMADDNPTVSDLSVDSGERVPLHTVVPL